MKRINMHNGHTASCLCCKHLYVTDEDPGYSEMTPGHPASIVCLKNIAEFDLVYAQEALKKMHDLGRACKKFEPKIEQGGAG